MAIKESFLHVPGQSTELETILLNQADGTEVHREVVALGGIESTDNTTTEKLGSAETFTGEGEFNVMPDVMVFCQTDNTGTLYFDFSVDGTNWTTFPVNGFGVASGVPEFHVAVKGPRWFRARLVNDTGAQTYLRLYTYFGTFRQGNAPINQTAALDADAIHVRPTEFFGEASLGRRSGVVAWAKFGHREGLLAASGEQTVWDTTGNYVVPTVASTMTITYDGTGGGTTDGAGTTGALVLRIFYIDGDGMPATLDHTLGTDGSDVTIETTLGINRVAVISAGSLTYNASNITITATTGGAKLAVVTASDSITHHAFFHVGANCDAVAHFLYLHVNKPSGGNAKVQIKGYIFNRATNVRTEVFRSTLDTTVEVTLDLNPTIGFTVPATGVLYFVADTDTNNAEAVVRFSLNEYQRV